MASARPCSCNRGPAIELGAELSSADGTRVNERDCARLDANTLANQRRSHIDMRPPVIHHESIQRDIKSSLGVKDDPFVAVKVDAISSIITNRDSGD